MALHTQPVATNSAQLRGDIDAGRTGDKSPGSDPAAAPLGTDEEAAGSGPTRQEIIEASLNERRSIAGRSNAVWAAFRPAGEVRAFPIVQLALICLVLCAAITTLILEVRLR